jgi:nicotinamidase-related amidase
MIEQETIQIYDKAGLGHGLSLGVRPAVLVVDFACGFTDAATPLGADMSAEVEATKQLLDVARAKAIPVIFTAVGYEASEATRGTLWFQKLPGLKDLEVGTQAVEIDPRLELRADEIVILKKGASAFFGTNLGSVLLHEHVDSVILCGATTSGCIRATAVDLLQHGWPTLVPRECVADRAQGPHEANLFDIQAKYADVVTLEDALSYLDTLDTERSPAEGTA